MHQGVSPGIPQGISKAFPRDPPERPRRRRASAIAQALAKAKTSLVQDPEAELAQDVPRWHLDLDWPTGGKAWANLEEPVATDFAEIARP